MKNTYNPPSQEILCCSKEKNEYTEEQENAKMIQETLCGFDAIVEVENVIVGNLITRYYIKPTGDTTVKEIKSLVQELQYVLGVENIKLSVIGEKQVIALDIPNQNSTKLKIGNLMQSENIKEKKIPLILGKDLNGENVVEDLVKLPNLLITGTTGTGKSNLLSTFVIDMIYQTTPEELRIILIDTRTTNFLRFKDIPNLLIPTVTDSREAIQTIKWLIEESYKRNILFAENKVDDFEDYNKIAQNKIPRIVVIIEDLCDLMMYDKKETEDNLYVLINIARKVGINIIISTYRASTDIITGRIKANIPARITFKTVSKVDSVTIIDMAGAENLLKNGDILFIKTEERRPKRIQVPYISDEEINKVIEEVKNNNDKAEINKEIEQYINDKPKDIDNYDINGEKDPLLEETIETVITTGQISTSFIQQRFKVSDVRAGRRIDQMEEKGIISEYNEGKPREVLATKDFDDTEEQHKIAEQEEITLEELKDENDKEENNYEIKNILKQWWFWVLIILLYIILKNL